MIESRWLQPNNRLMLRITTNTIHRYFPYCIITGALGIVFIIVLIILIQQKQLLPGIVILGSFILFVLFIIGTIVIGIELWGEGNVNGNCNMYVQDMESRGQSVETLAWMQQDSICQSWKAGWASLLIGTVFLFWMIVMSYQVYKDE